MNNKVSFRFAEPGDEALILWFIKELATYERMLDEMTATESLIREWIFNQRKAEVIFAVAEGHEVGYTLFFHSFSSFTGQAGIHMEDLFVLPECRGNGYGKALIKELGHVAAARECGCLEWTCLNWNQPSIDFYLSLGATPLTAWTIYRLAGEPLRALAGQE